MIARAAALALPAGLALVAPLLGCFGTGTRRVDAPCREMRSVVVWEMLRDNPTIQLVDLRQPPEVTAKEGRLPRALEVPFDRLVARAPHLAKDRTVVVFARHGDVGKKACELLVGLSFKYVIFMSDGAEGWFRQGLPAAPAGVPAPQP